jgi:ATP/ADP translocase
MCVLHCSDTVAPTLKALGLTPLMAAVLVGAAQNVFSKSAKYSLFDPCKEMAYIPLDDEVCDCRVPHCPLYFVLGCFFVQ